MSIGYYMDECQPWELSDIIDCVPYTDRNLWEAIRLNSYILAQANSTKKLKISDVASFVWDKKETPVTDISNEDINRLREKAKQWEQ